MALAAEAVLEKRQDEGRELRKRHEQAAAELSLEMTEKKRLGMEAVAARLKVWSMTQRRQNYCIYIFVAHRRQLRVSYVPTK